MSMDANIPPHVKDEVRELEVRDAEAIRETLEYKPFPLEALPKEVGRYVIESSKAIPCDPSYTALPLLSTLAAGVGNSMRLKLKNSWEVPCLSLIHI